MESETSLAEVAEFVRQTAEHMRKFGLTSVKVNHNGTRIKIRSASVSTPGSSQVMLDSTVIAPEDETIEAPVDEGHLLFSPMIGTYFSASAPDEPSFVEVGDEVDAGQTVGIIEAMKIMNEITADRAGVISEILVKNAQAVEYGQPLMRITARAD